MIRKINLKNITDDFTILTVCLTVILGLLLPFIKINIIYWNIMLVCLVISGILNFSLVFGSKSPAASNNQENRRNNREEIDNITACCNIVEPKSTSNNKTNSNYSHIHILSLLIMFKNRYINE